MALRNILTKEEPALYRKSRTVTKFDGRLHQMLDDMAETLEKANGDRRARGGERQCPHTAGLSDNP